VAKSAAPIIALCAISFALGAYGPFARHPEGTAPGPSEPATTSVPAASSEQSPEVCFSPDEPCEERLARFVGSARKSLDLAIYDINLEEVGELLISFSKKIPVRIVVDRRQSKERNSIVPTLESAGVKIRFGHQRGIMHNKFAIIDGARLETGSFNYTHHASLANQENQLYLTDSRLIARYQKRFNQMWERANEP
jgi:phosphatidylserine/phosphatidylglycerophosphate/cardiolipin synthase-like enzyme